VWGVASRHDSKLNYNAIRYYNGLIEISKHEDSMSGHRSGRWNLNTNQKGE
jgi:hypothetical protein